MLYLPTIISIIEVLIVVVPALLVVAFVTIAERKTMASMQRRLGPNSYVSPTQANLILFFLGPIITLIFSLLGYAIVPYGPGLTIMDYNLGILYILAVSSLSTYGSLRSTAQLISYELILSSAILLVVLLAVPLFPIFIIFFIGSIAETNRAPFDLAEAESELVSGFMTEHSAVIFVFFFLAEYASIVLICILNISYNPLVEGILCSVVIGFKALVIAFIVLIPCILYSFEIIPSNIALL
ncbi:respiratory-chain NADH dehydrogenase [Glonium stellatum]|uniref:Respiratory-chain NADH dehydrogenase n=1 Tax=Glonium stellatum TaxID=574774 RepID=A0A8E2FAT1_9PEZI|nr:respiratory-chain NADH dehydrogenase [Glonium stellatum]